MVGFNLKEEATSGPFDYIDMGCRRMPQKVMQVCQKDLGASHRGRQCIFRFIRLCRFRIHRINALFNVAYSNVTEKQYDDASKDFGPGELRGPQNKVSFFCDKDLVKISKACRRGHAVPPPGSTSRTVTALVEPSNQKHYWQWHRSISSRFVGSVPLVPKIRNR
jgi:hypothetical protein